MVSASMGSGGGGRGRSGGGGRTRSSISGGGGGRRALRMLSMLDSNPKTSEDFVHRTTSGGAITLVCYLVCGVLFATETRQFLAPKTVHDLAVDSSRGETIPVNFDVTFHKMPCAWLSLDAMDVSGDLHLDVERDVSKQRLAADGAPVGGAERHAGAPAPRHHHQQQQLEGHAIISGSGSSGNGTADGAAHASSSESAAAAAATAAAAAAAAACGSCYGADDADHPCCATCDDVRTAYARKGWVMLDLSHVRQCARDARTREDELRAQEGEGCRMYGRLNVRRVAGNIHFAPGRSYQRGGAHVHDLAPFAGKTLDFAHTIQRLSFGPPYPGMANPLDGARGGTAAGAGSAGGAASGPGMHQYFIKVVPTAYVDERSNVTTLSNTYSVTEHFRESAPAVAGAASGRTLPGVFFFYDLSPLRVRIVRSRRSLLHYVTNVCALVGGVYAVTGLVDAAAHGALKKALGKVA